MKYLGLLVEVNPRKLSTWDLVVDIVRKRLKGLLSKHLSMGEINASEICLGFNSDRLLVFL